MAIERLILDRYVRLTVDGRVTNQDIADAVSEILDLPGFVPDTPVLVVDRAGAYRGTTADTRAAASQLESLQEAGLGRMAVIAPQTLQFGIGRQIESHAESRDVQFRVFRSERDALEWLGITPDEGP